MSLSAAELQRRVQLTRTEWREYQEAEAWRKTTPPTWKPALTAQQQAQIEVDIVRYSLPF